MRRRRVVPHPPSPITLPSPPVVVICQPTYLPLSEWLVVCKNSFVVCFCFEARLIVCASSAWPFRLVARRPLFCFSPFALPLDHCSRRTSLTINHSQRTHTHTTSAFTPHAHIRLHCHLRARPPHRDDRRPMRRSAMMRRLQRFRIGLPSQQLLLLLSLSALLLVRAAPSTAPARVGVVLPLTGSQAQYAARVQVSRRRGGAARAGRRILCAAVLRCAIRAHDDHPCRGCCVCVAWLL